MKTTLNLKDELVKRAMDLTKINEKTLLIHTALEALISNHAKMRLIVLGGTDKKVKNTKRKRID